MLARKEMQVGVQEVQEMDIKVKIAMETGIGGLV